MESIKPGTPNEYSGDYETPKNKEYFMFPPESTISSIDRSFKDMINCPPPSLNSRRSFTPCKNSVLLHTPDFSPIEVNYGKFTPRGIVHHLPAENVCKAPADSTTVNISEKYNYNNPDVIRLMPPPPPRRPFQATTSNGEFQSNSKVHLRNPKTGKLLCEYPMIEWKKDQDVIGIRMETPHQFYSPEMRSNLFEKHIDLDSTLAYYGLSKYIDVFKREEIDFGIFLTLTNENLIQIGIVDRKDREFMLSFIKDFSTTFKQQF